MQMSLNIWEKVWATDNFAIENSNESSSTLSLMDQRKLIWLLLWIYDFYFSIFVRKNEYVSAGITPCLAIKTFNLREMSLVVCRIQ